MSQLASNISSLDVDDDWAIRSLVESTCEGLDDSDWEWDFPQYKKPKKPVGETSQALATVPPLTSELEPLNVISQCHLLGFDSVNAEEGYHSGVDSISDDDCYNFKDGGEEG